MNEAPMLEPKPNLLAAPAAELADAANHGVEPIAAFPPSAAQRRLWFLDRWQPGTALYTTGRVIDFDGELDQDALARALGVLATRHESLRTTFFETDGEPVQRIAPTGDLPLRVKPTPPPAAGKSSSARSIWRSDHWCARFCFASMTSSTASS